MKGVGSHQSLPKNADLTFNENGTWSSTAPLQGLSAGSWFVEDKNIVSSTTKHIHLL